MPSTSHRIRAGPLAIYLSQIHATPLLTRAEEQSLARTIQADPDPRHRAEPALSARSHLILANLPLVVSVARSFLRRGLPLEDLVEEGNHGLCMAADRFHTDGSRFSTYATYWIRERILLALRTENSGRLRVPNYLVVLLNRWNKTVRALANQLRRPPTFEEVAETGRFTKAQRRQVQRAVTSNAMVRHEEATLYDMALERVLYDHRENDPAEMIGDADELTDVVARLDSLVARHAIDERAYAVVRARLGFDGEPPTLKACGEQVGLTKEGVRYVFRQTMDLMRDEMRPAAN